MRSACHCVHLGFAMTRLALSALLLSMSAFCAAQVVTPNHASGDGTNANCPESRSAAEVAPIEGRADDLAPPVAATQALPAKAAPPRATPAVRPKTGMRWHSFLPGMMK